MRQLQSRGSRFKCQHSYMPRKPDSAPAPHLQPLLVVGLELEGADAHRPLLVRVHDQIQALVGHAPHLRGGGKRSIIYCLYFNCAVSRLAGVIRPDCMSA